MTTLHLCPDHPAQENAYLDMEATPVVWRCNVCERILRGRTALAIALALEEEARVGVYGLSAEFIDREATAGLLGAAEKLLESHGDRPALIMVAVPHQCLTPALDGISAQIDAEAGA